jgi:hypothetical protein
LLPRAKAHAASALAPTRTVMQLDADHFSLREHGASRRGAMCGRPEL